MQPKSDWTSSHVVLLLMRLMSLSVLALKFYFLLHTWSILNDHLKSILIGNEVKSQREPGHETDAQSMRKKKLSSLGVFSPIDLNGYFVAAEFSGYMLSAPWWALLFTRMCHEKILYWCCVFT